MSFNPDWRDDVAEMEAKDIPLTLPPDTVNRSDKKIWVESRYVLSEQLFFQTYRYDIPRKRTYLLRQSDAGKHYTITDDKGNQLEGDQQRTTYNFIFPPRVLMADGLQERSMAYAATKTACGDILVGGLGLAVYPQIVLHLKRPVTSITIVESSREVIDIVGRKWFEHKNQQQITIVEDTIEHYLRHAQNLYDTIYLDIWGDIHFKILPYVNYLITSSEPRLKENGKIQCWGYNAMMRAFVKFAERLELEDLKKLRIDPPEDLLLVEYLEWRKQQQKPSILAIRQKGRELATIVSADRNIPLSIDVSRSKWL